MFSLINHENKRWIKYLKLSVLEHLLLSLHKIYFPNKGKTGFKVPLRPSKALAY